MQLDTVLSLQYMTHLILTAILCKWHYCYVHFINDKYEAEWNNKLRKVTELMCH